MRKTSCSEIQMKEHLFIPVLRRGNLSTWSTNTKIPFILISLLQINRVLSFSKFKTPRIKPNWQARLGNRFVVQIRRLQNGDERGNSTRNFYSFPGLEKISLNYMCMQKCNLIYFSSRKNSRILLLVSEQCDWRINKTPGVHLLMRAVIID